MNDSELPRKKILLLKVGGSSITQKGKLETLDVEALNWFSKTIRSTIDEDFLSCENDEPPTLGNGKPAMIIVHGAGSFGHHTAKHYGLGGKASPPPDGMVLTKALQTGIAKTRRSVKKLNSAVVSSLIDDGINAVGISPCLNVPGLMAHGGDEYQGATLLARSIRETLAAGLVPVIHGDAGLYGNYERDSMSAGILGGDTLVEIIAKNPLLQRDLWKTVFLTDVDGVFTKDPKRFPDATLVKNIFIDPRDGKILNAVSASGSSHEHDVTGGLEAKLGAAANVARAGVDVVVAKCGSKSARIAMSESDSGKNSHNHTLIRLHSNN